MDLPVYQKTQFGTAVVAVTLVVALVEVWFTARHAQPLAGCLILVAVCAAIGALFSSLTIAISSTAVEWWLTFHLFPQRIELADIDLAATKRLPWYTSFGIRFNGRLVAWIVTGYGAIELVRRNGKRIILSTSDPAGALAAIHAAIGPQ
jgi:hypothetical protein